MNRRFKILVLAVAAICSFSFIAEDVFGRRGGGSSSSSRSFSSSRSSPSRSPSRSSSWRSKRTSTASQRRSSKQPTVNKGKPTRSKADQAAVARAKKAGTSFKTKGEAQKAFASKNGAKYKQTPTPGKPAPTTRPSHIPKSYSHGGKTVNVTYNVNQGGYGHWSGGGMGLGTYIMYDAMMDAAMMSTLMRRNNYVHPDTYPMRSPAVVHHGGGFGFFAIFGIIVFGVFVFAAIGLALSR